MLEYKDQYQQKDLILDSAGYQKSVIVYTRSLTKKERNQQEYFRRLKRQGIESKEIAKRAKKALKSVSRKERILASCAKLTNSGQ